jgi:CDP-glucose 4,6-dehydratase
MLDTTFWKNKRVFLTGHTGFKGSWLCLMLDRLGAEVSGYALKPPTKPGLFQIAEVKKFTRTTLADINDFSSLRKAMRAASPEIVIHMAAQSIVRESYAHPLGTYATNVMGTVNVLEASRGLRSLSAIINVTSDKCYENREQFWSFRETDPLGGFDPYSNSKACSELVTAAYRRSFFNVTEQGRPGPLIATARSGNVLGGGDWAKDRLVPDCIRSIQNRQKIVIRNPRSVRPWQHVLEPLTGYLMLAEQLSKKQVTYAGAWNFGPDNDDAQPVSWIVKQISHQFKGLLEVVKSKEQKAPYEAGRLILDSAKARCLLGWRPRWNLEQALAKTTAWYQDYLAGRPMRSICRQQLDDYFNN